MSIVELAVTVTPPAAVEVVVPPVGVVDVVLPPAVVQVQPGVGPPGAPGAPGPTAVSADPGNMSTLGSDLLIFTPLVEGGGSVILDGNGPPAMDIGTEGDYYVDTLDGGDLYGPKGQGDYGGPLYQEKFYESIKQEDVASFALGIAFRTTAPALYCGGSIYIPAANTVPNGFVVELWQGSTRLAADNCGPVAAGGWHYQAATNPVELQPGTEYVFSYFTPAGGHRTYATPGVDQQEGILTLTNKGFYANTPGTPLAPWTFLPVITPAVQGIDTSLVWPVAVESGGDRVARGGDTMTGPLQVANKNSGAESLTVWAAPGQVAPLTTWRDPGGNVKATMDYAGGFSIQGALQTIGIARIAAGANAIDIWNDGRIYFAQQAVSIGAAGGVFNVNTAVTLPADPAQPLHAATKQYVDAAKANATDNTKVLKAGDTMTGNLNINGTYAGKLYGGVWQGFGAGNATSDPSILTGTVDRTNKDIYVLAPAGGTVWLRPNGDSSKDFTVSSTGVTARTPVTLPADPTTALQAATKRYVDAKIPALLERIAALEARVARMEE